MNSKARAKNTLPTRQSITEPIPPLDVSYMEKCNAEIGSAELSVHALLNSGAWSPCSACQCQRLGSSAQRHVEDGIHGCCVLRTNRALVVVRSFLQIDAADKNADAADCNKAGHNYSQEASYRNVKHITMLIGFAHVGHRGSGSTANVSRRGCSRIHNDSGEVSTLVLPSCMICIRVGAERRDPVAHFFPLPAASHAEAC